MVEAGGREAGTVYPVRHSVEQKSWVEPFLWYAVCPFCRIFLQPEQETRTAVLGTEGSILLMPEDATAGWKPDDSCGAKRKKNTQRKHRVTVRDGLKHNSLVCRGQAQSLGLHVGCQGLKEN